MTALIERIESGDAEWGWANNDANKRSLQAALAALQASLPPAAQRILIGGLAKLKTAMPEEELVGQLEVFIKIEDAVERVAKMHKRLLEMHSKARAFD